MIIDLVADLDAISLAATSADARPPTAARSVHCTSSAIFSRTLLTSNSNPDHPLSLMGTSMRNSGNFT